MKKGVPYPGSGLVRPRQELAVEERMNKRKRVADLKHRHRRAKYERLKKMASVAGVTATPTARRRERPQAVEVAAEPVVAVAPRTRRGVRVAAPTPLPQETPAAPVAAVAAEPAPRVARTRRAAPRPPETTEPSPPARRSRRVAPAETGAAPPAQAPQEAAKPPEGSETGAPAGPRRRPARRAAPQTGPQEGAADERPQGGTS